MNMFKKSFAVALLALMPLLVNATAAFVQRVNNTANGATVTISPTAANLLIIAIKTSAGGGTPTASLTDNLSDTYSTALATFSGSSWNITFFYLKNIPSGITTLTATFAGGTPGNTDISVVEYSGLDTSAPFIGITADNIQVAPGATTDVITSATISLTNVPAMLIGFSIDNPNNGTPTAGTGFTGHGSGGTSAGAATWEDKRFTSNTTPAATFTSATHGTDTFDTFALAFSEPSAGGGAALASAASDAVSATGALKTGAGAFAQLTIGLGTTPNDGTGDPARTAFSKLNVMESQFYGVRSVQTPTTGFTIAPAQGVTQLVLNPAGTLATGTLTFPPNPGDNEPFEVLTTQTITALTCNTSDGSTINGAPTTMSANTAFQYRFIASLSKWVREQ